MKKQTKKKQTTAKRSLPKPARQVKPKATVKPKAKQTAKSKAKPKKPKPVAAPPPPVAKVKAKPVVVSLPPSVAESNVRSKPAVAALLPPSIAKPNQSELDELRRIEIALAEAENGVAENGLQTLTVNPVSAGLMTELTELLEELIDTASPKLSSTISRLAFVLCEVMPGLQAVSKRADIALCRKNGVTFGWDRRAEAERAVRSGKWQKSIAVS
jgi:hypothetical protein